MVVALKSAISKEARLQVHRKMDAISLQGVWLNFPKVAGHGTRVVAGIYAELMAAERRLWGRVRHPVETARQMRQRLLKEVERRIVQMDQDDLFLILSV